MTDYQGAIATLQGVAHGLRLGGRAAPGDMIDAAIGDIEATIADLVTALEGIVQFCDDPHGSEKPESLAMGMARLLPPARAALARVRRQP